MKPTAVAGGPVVVALSSSQDEAGVPLRVPDEAMLARVGAWLGHPAMPEVVDREHLRSALRYFERHYAANGVDLVIDYHHASVVAPLGGTTAPAAGWVRAMELRNDDTELWGKVLWTAEAATAIESRRFRYLSPVLKFGAPDRVSGERVPMVIHSVALTNTPFLTELTGLNASGGPPGAAGGAAATDGGGADSKTGEGGESMSLLDVLAEALGVDPADVATRLGGDVEADDVAVAQAVMAALDRTSELEAAAAEPVPPVSPAVANALGVPPDADETAVKAAVIRLKAPGAGLAGVRRALGLPEDADEPAVLNSIAGLQRARAASAAEDLVDAAVEAGRIPPAHREFYLREALSDLEAARQVVNALPVITVAPQARPDASGAALTETQEAVCRQLGVSPEAFMREAR